MSIKLESSWDPRKMPSTEGWDKQQNKLPHPQNCYEIPSERRQLRFSGVWILSKYLLGAGGTKPGPGLIQIRSQIFSLICIPSGVSEQSLKHLFVLTHKMDTFCVKLQKFQQVPFLIESFGEIVIIYAALVCFWKEGTLTLLLSGCWWLWCAWVSLSPQNPLIVWCLF